MYHKLPIGAIAAGGGIAVASGVPSLFDLGIGLLAAGGVLAVVSLARRFRLRGSHRG